MAVERIDKIVDKIISDLDLRRKEIGDKIEISDYSSVTDMKDHRLCRFDFVNIPYLIVIETGLRVELNIFNTTFRQDLIAVDPKTNIKYRIASAHTRIKDNKLKVKTVKNL
ncbi:MAG TPA: hypothetical protein VK172_10470 [Lentimicrobium sp.]|nr:hypothetical protein [Lentimicrobium sp.]